MPTLPLYDVRMDHADAAHRIAAPGGYEIWSFEAEDRDRQIHVTASLSCGYPFHPGYQRRYAAYRRWPTRVAPPLPIDFPCAALVIYEGDLCRARFVTQVKPEAFRASIDRPRVRVGPSHFEADDHGAIHLQMRGALREGRTLTAKLSFAPILPHAPTRIALHPGEVSGADHFWVPVNPLCRVEGEILIFSDGSPAARVMKFAGLGCHDHRFGSGPLGAGMSSMIRGRVLTEDRATMFVHAVPADVSRPEETVFVSAHGEGIRRERVAGLRNRKRRTRLGLKYPQRLRFGELLTIHQPRVVSSTWCCAHVLYQVAESDQQARCEIFYPARLRTPLIGRMLEREIVHA